MKNIFITATNTDVGKTYTTIKLIRALAEKKIKPGVFKPIETGVDKYPQDASLLLLECQKANGAFNDIKTDDISPLQFSLPASPFVANNLKDIDIEVIFEKKRELEKICDILLIEGAGGLMVPIKRGYFMIDLLKDLRPVQPLLVTHDRLGCINDTLLSLNLLKNSGFCPKWCINVRNKESFEKITLPFYENNFKEIFKLDENLSSLVDRLISS